MKKSYIDGDLLIVVGSVVLLVFIFGFVIWLSFNQGSWDRFWSGINKDKVTVKDQVYQTGSVRVYKFTEGNTVCYLADKQSESVGIFCK